MDADSGAVHRGDHRLQAFEDTKGDLAAPVPDAWIGSIGLGSVRRIAHRLAEIEGLGAAGEVGARAEASSGSGHNHASHVIVSVNPVKGLDQFILHGLCERVQTIGTVQRDLRNAVFDVIKDVLERFRHGLLRSGPRGRRQAKGFFRMLGGRPCPRERDFRDEWGALGFDGLSEGAEDGRQLLVVEPRADLVARLLATL